MTPPSKRSQPPNKPPLAVLADLREWRSFAPGLERMRAALDALGEPHRAAAHAIVGGTNGKGTVAYNLALQAPKPCGLFVSPHVMDVRERITLAGEPFPDEAWRAAYAEILAAMGEPALSYFEWMLLLAACMFRRAGVRYAVYEVGLGGRLDAVNALDPQVSTLTNVSLDHVEILGDTVEKIALEKAAIARPGRPFVAPRSVWNIASVRRRLGEIGSDNRIFDDAPGYEAVRRPFDAALAALGWPPYAGELKRLPGRRMRLGQGLWLDGAHNPAGWADLAVWIRREAGAPVRVLTALSQGRDPEVFLRIMQPVAHEVVVWRAGFERELPAEDWPAGTRFVDDDGLPELLREPLLVCGSLYAVGRFLAWRQAA